jgi:hypothetical protein
VDIVGDVIATIQDGNGSPYYYYGHAAEMVNTLMEKDASDTWRLKKYPAIFLFHNFEETRDSQTVEAEITLAIVTETRPEWKAADRYTNIFDPTLTPIYDNLIDAFRDYEGLEVEDSHKVKIYPYWGSEQGKNVANDYADAIEVTLKIKVYATCDTNGLPYLILAQTGVTGRYVYLYFSKAMQDPSDNPGSIIVSNETEEFATESAILSENTKIFILDLGSEQLEAGDAIKLSIASDTFLSESGEYLPGYSNYVVTNNVQ